MGSALHVSSSARSRLPLADTLMGAAASAFLAATTASSSFTNMVLSKFSWPDLPSEECTLTPPSPETVPATSSAAAKAGLKGSSRRRSLFALSCSFLAFPENGLRLEPDAGFPGRFPRRGMAPEFRSTRPALRLPSHTVTRAIGVTTRGFWGCSGMMVDVFWLTGVIEHSVDSSAVRVVTPVKHPRKGNTFTWTQKEKALSAWCGFVSALVLGCGFATCRGGVVDHGRDVNPFVGRLAISTAARLRLHLCG